eukprot:2320026-Alexandrium_andersonii.AAC.1
MSASLVGSEMCIRDSFLSMLSLEWRFQTIETATAAQNTHIVYKRAPRAVSYTHLTLPTICSV